MILIILVVNIIRVLKLAVFSCRAKKVKAAKQAAYLAEHRRIQLQIKAAKEKREIN